MAVVERRVCDKYGTQKDVGPVSVFVVARDAMAENEYALLTELVGRLDEDAVLVERSVDLSKPALKVLTDSIERALRKPVPRKD